MNVSRALSRLAAKFTAGLAQIAA